MADHRFSSHSVIGPGRAAEEEGGYPVSGGAANSGSVRRNKPQEMSHLASTPCWRRTREAYRYETLQLLPLAAARCTLHRTPSTGWLGAGHRGRGASRLSLSRVLGSAYLVKMQHRHMLVLRTRMRAISGKLKIVTE